MIKIKYHKYDDYYLIELFNLDVNKQTQVNISKQSSVILNPGDSKLLVKISYFGIFKITAYQGKRYSTCYISNGTLYWQPSPSKVDGYKIYLVHQKTHYQYVYKVDRITSIPLVNLNIPQGSYQCYLTSIKDDRESKPSNIIYFKWYVF